MTLVFAAVYGNGVVIFADSKAASPEVAYEERKIMPIYLDVGGEEVDLAAVAGAGDAALVKKGFAVVKRAFVQFYREKGRHPSSEEVEDIMGKVERRLVNLYSFLKWRGVDAFAEHIVATVSREGEPHLYLCRGVCQPMHHSPGFAVLGIAEQSALVLLRLLGWGPEASWSPELLAAFVIDTVAEVVPTVSPLMSFRDTLYIRMQEGKVVMGPLREEAFEEAKRRALARRRLFKELWALLESGVEEEEVLKALERLRP